MEPDLSFAGMEPEAIVEAVWDAMYPRPEPRRQRMYIVADGYPEFCATCRELHRRAKQGT